MYPSVKSVYVIVVCSGLADLQIFQLQLFMLSSWHLSTVNGLVGSLIFFPKHQRQCTTYQ